MGQIGGKDRAPDRMTWPLNKKLTDRLLNQHGERPYSQNRVLLCAKAGAGLDDQIVEVLLQA